MISFRFAGRAQRLWAAAAVAGGLALTPGAAVADSPVICWGSHQNVDSGSGYSKGTYWMKTGPYEDCGRAGQTYKGTLLYYHCYVTNGYNNTWSYVRIAGTSQEGWISDANLTLNPDGFSHGAVKPCTPNHI